MKRSQVRLSYLTFTLALEEMLSGPFTAKGVSEHCGITHRNVCQLVRTMHEKKVVYVSGWEKDAIGRVGVKVYSLGHGTDARRPHKPRTQINREYRSRINRAVLAGTPFAGLGA